MVYFVLLFIEIIILFLLSRSTSKVLSGFMSVNLLSFIFLPGIIIHELSHLLVAVMLFVPVGNMEFAPKRNGNTVKLGSVEIGRTDPVRRSIIGFAPVLAGLTIICAVIYFFSSNILFFQDKGFYFCIAFILVLAYFLFAISNTMFSSSKDMEGAAEILITLLILFAGVHVLGFHPSLSVLDEIFNKELLAVIQKSTFFLLVPIIIDLLILGIIRLFMDNQNQNGRS